MDFLLPSRRDQEDATRSAAESRPYTPIPPSPSLVAGGCRDDGTVRALPVCCRCAAGNASNASTVRHECHSGASSLETLSDRHGCSASLHVRVVPELPVIRLSGWRVVEFGPAGIDTGRSCGVDPYECPLMRSRARDRSLWTDPPFLGYIRANVSNSSGAIDVFGFGRSSSAVVRREDRMMPDPLGRHEWLCFPSWSP